MLIFLDLETTGLDPHKCSILEVAAVAYDPAYHCDLPECNHGRELSRFHAVIFASGDALQDMDPYVLKMHARSGLLDACMQPGTYTLDQVAFRLHKWLARLIDPSYGEPGHPILDRKLDHTFTLAGNSIHFDRSFLRVYMPEVHKLFHYRMLDVSALHLAAEAFGRPRAERPAVPAHRAMADVLDSIRQFEFYR